VSSCSSATGSSWPCHPAEALALAVRARAPILAQDSALALARPVTSDAGDVRQWLDRVNPGDFEAGPAR
jgi:bifunctional DNase/RNase